MNIRIDSNFADRAESAVVFSPEERVSIEGKGASQFQLLVPSSTNNMIDPILIELAPGEKLQSSGPHPGEQFGYVLNGTATLMLDKAEHRVPAKHCFYFKADRTSQIVNKNKSAAKLLWIISPPQM